MTDTGVSSIYYVLLLVLVGSSLIGMRLPIAKAAKMALAWVAIFAAMFAVMAFRGEFAAFGNRLYAEAVGAPVESGGELRIPMAEDGHFWVQASMNGVKDRFLVDSGASTTTIAADFARAAGVSPGSRRRVVETANGQTTVFPAYVERLEVGPLQREDFRVDINRNDGVNLLGMNFLSSLSGWRVENNSLVLVP